MLLIEIDDLLYRIQNKSSINNICEELHPFLQKHKYRIAGGIATGIAGGIAANAAIHGTDELMHRIANSSTPDKIKAIGQPIASIGKYVGSKASDTIPHIKKFITAHYQKNGT